MPPKPSLPRCPNGERRNPKTGKCEKIKIKDKDPNCKACMMIGPGRRPKHTCVRNENGKLIKNKTKTPITPFQKPNNLNINTPSISQRKPCMACVKYEEGLLNPKTKVCEVFKKSKSLNKSPNVLNNIVSNITPADLKELRKKALLKGKMKMLMKKAVHKVRKPENLNSIKQINISNYPDNIIQQFQDKFHGKSSEKSQKAFYRFIISKYRDVIHPVYKRTSMYIYHNTSDEKKVKIDFDYKNFEGDVRILPYHFVNALKTKKRFIIYILGLTMKRKVNNVLTNTHKHRTLIIFDMKDNTYYRYDPHGWGGKLFGNIIGDKIDTYVEKSVNEAFALAKLQPLKKPNKIFDNPPRLKWLVQSKHGPQYYDKAKATFGKCQNWCLAFFHHRLHYPDKSVIEIDKMMGAGDEKVASEFITKYIIFLMNNIHFHKYFNSEQRYENYGPWQNMII